MLIKSKTEFVGTETLSPVIKLVKLSLRIDYTLDHIKPVIDQLMLEVVPNLLVIT